MAHEYRAKVKWKRDDAAKFTDQRYSRGTRWSFDGGITVPASSSPLSVKLPLFGRSKRSIPRRRWSPRCRAATC